MGSGYFNDNGILLLETAWLYSFMSVYIAIILPVTLWYVDSALFLKYKDCGLEFWLAGHLEKGSVHCSSYK